MEPNEKASPPTAASGRNYRIGVGLLLALIVYGSLYPLTWNFAQPQEFIFRGSIGLADLLENVVLFLPLGSLLAWRYRGQPGQRAGFAIWFLVALAVASVLQWLQKYLPRTPALSDIGFNMLGFLLGWVGGMVAGNSLQRLAQRHLNLHGADRFALVMLVLWLAAELFPFIPTIDRSSIFDNVKSLWQQAAWQPRRMLLHAGMALIGLEALAHLLRSVAAEHLVRPLAVVATLAMLGGKFIVVHQTPGVPVVLGIIAGTATWVAVDRLAAGCRLWSVAAVATASYLLHALWPLRWNDVPSAMSWLPFASSLAGSIEAVVTSVAFESLCFGAIIWSAVRNGAAPGGVAASVAVVAFACEWAQRYLPGRTAEITSVVLALGMGWLVVALGDKPYFKRGTY